MEINIYIELDSMSPKTTEGYYGYVLEWKTKTREGFGKTEGSPAKRLLVASQKPWTESGLIVQ